MDERYLFRGKNKRGWHIGNITETIHGFQIYTTKNGFTGPNDLIIPETIGQCTGIRDRNGELIFDSDILKNHFDNSIEVVRKDEFCSDFFCIWKETELEVIGNIHDNTELMRMENE